MLWLAGATVAAAQPPAASQDYLREMPPAARVLADYQGRDAMDRRARQMAALGLLLDIMRDMAGTRALSGVYPNAAEKPIQSAYAVEINRLRTEGIATFAPGPASIDSPRAKWLGSIQRLQRSDALYAELMSRYFTPAFQARHRGAAGANAALSAAGRQAINQGLRDLKGDGTRSTWERMTAEEQSGAIAFGTLMIALLAIGALRELLPFDVVNLSTSPVLRFGLGRARLTSATGVVSNLRATDHTTSTLWERVSTTGAVSQFWTSTTIRHEEFDLLGDSSPHHVHTSHLTFDGVKTGEFDRVVGQPLVAVWATRRLRKQGPYVLFRQPGAADLPVTCTNAALSRLLAPRAWTVLPMMGLGFVLGSSTDILGGPMVSGSLRGLGVAALVTPVWLAIYFAIAWRRRSRFDRRELPKLYAVIDGVPASEVARLAPGARGYCALIA